MSEVKSWHDVLGIGPRVDVRWEVPRRGHNQSSWAIVSIFGQVLRHRGVLRHLRRLTGTPPNLRVLGVVPNQGIIQITVQSKVVVVARFLQELQPSVFTDQPEEDCLLARRCFLTGTRLNDP